MVRSAKNVGTTIGHLERIELFVLRARKIESSTLFASREDLKEKSEPKLVLEADDLGFITNRKRDFPDEVLLESLLANVRPVALSTEQCYYDKVANSVQNYFGLAPPTDIMEKIDNLKTKWKNEVSKGYKQALSNLSSPAGQVSNNDLAWGWVYGEVLHHDAARRAYLQRFDINDQFEAAVPLIFTIALLSLSLLDFILELHYGGRLTLSDECLTRSVKFSPDKYNEILKEDFFKISRDAKGNEVEHDFFHILQESQDPNLEKKLRSILLKCDSAIILPIALDQALRSEKIPNSGEPYELHLLLHIFMSKNKGVTYLKATNSYTGNSIVLKYKSNGTDFEYEVLRKTDKTIEDLISNSKS